MKNNTSNVMRKEFSRFFGDRRMLFMLILPAIMIYVLYTFMGTALSSMISTSEEYAPALFAVNMPGEIEQIMREANIGINPIGAGEAEGIKERISQKSADLLMIFPVGFSEQVKAYDAQASGGLDAPNIEVYFNSTAPNSSSTNSLVLSLLDVYESKLANKFDINRGIPGADLVTKEDLSASIISYLMPMLLMVFLYQGCAALAPESIAGEKERGTLATLLVTPLKRSQLAAGKIFSLCVLSFISALLTTASTMLSLPNMMGAAEGLVDAGIYGPRDWMFLAFVILSTTLLLVALISIISAYAKSVKEANTAVMPLMIVVIIVGISGMFSSVHTETIYYMIPLYGSVQSMSGIFALNYDAYTAVNVGASCISNLVCAGIGVFALTKMFNSEKVMFSK